MDKKVILSKVLSVEPLNLKTWLICGLLAALVIPVDIIRKLLVG